MIASNCNGSPSQSGHLPGMGCSTDSFCKLPRHYHTFCSISFEKHWGMGSHPIPFQIRADRDLAKIWPNELGTRLQSRSIYWQICQGKFASLSPSDHILPYDACIRIASSPDCRCLTASVLNGAEASLSRGAQAGRRSIAFP